MPGKSKQKIKHIILLLQNDFQFFLYPNQYPEILKDQKLHCFSLLPLSVLFQEAIVPTHSQLRRIIVCICKIETEFPKYS